MSKGSVIFFGNEQLSTGYNSDSAPIFEYLLNSGYAVKALILNQKSSKDADSLAVGKLAQTNEIPIFWPQTSSDLEYVVHEHRADFAVLAAYGKIISPVVLDTFKKGIINIHPSLLPEYRGPTPIEQALLDGLDTTGVSIIRLGQKMDAGDIYIQQEVAIDKTDTKLTLVSKLSLLGAELLSDNLDDIIAGKLLPQKQDELKATYCKLIQKLDGSVDTQKPATQLVREIRAYAGWPKSSLEYKTLKIIILEAQSSEVKVEQGKLVFEDDRLMLGCDNSSLEIISLQLAGKKPMDVKSFYNGFRHILVD